MRITSYYNQLLRAATAKNLRLRDAFRHAGLNQSVYWRVKKYGTLQLATAERVMTAIVQMERGTPDGERADDYRPVLRVDE